MNYGINNNYDKILKPFPLFGGSLYAEYGAEFVVGGGVRNPGRCFINETRHACGLCPAGTRATRNKTGGNVRRRRVCPSSITTESVRLYVGARNGRAIDIWDFSDFPRELSGPDPSGVRLSTDTHTHVRPANPEPEQSRFRKFGETLAEIWQLRRWFRHGEEGQS